MFVREGLSLPVPCGMLPFSKEWLANELFAEFGELIVKLELLRLRPNCGNGDNLIVNSFFSSFVLLRSPRILDLGMYPYIELGDT